MYRRRGSDRSVCRAFKLDGSIGQLFFLSSKFKSDRDEFNPGRRVLMDRLVNAAMKVKIAFNAKLPDGDT